MAQKSQLVVTGPARLFLDANGLDRRLKRSRLERFKPSSGHGIGKNGHGSLGFLTCFRYGSRVLQTQPPNRSSLSPPPAKAARQSASSRTRRATASVS
jgi:hypothetical protein